MMKTTDGFHYAYNAQAVVDEASPVVIVAEVVQSAADADQLPAMADAADRNLGVAGADDRFDLLLADAGYCSEANLEDAEEAGLDVLVATGHMRRSERVVSPRGRVPKNATRRELMARRRRTEAGRADYARRKAIVEGPVPEACGRAGPDAGRGG